MGLAARQLRKTRAEMERELKARDKRRLKELREHLKQAKRDRQTKVRAVGARCRAQRKAITERAKRARVRLRESIERTRQRAKGLCNVSRGEVREQTLQEIERAVQALTTEQREQAKLKAWTRPVSCAVPRGRARERQQESDCEVAANIDDVGLRIVWDNVKHRIKAGARRTRTEAFLEWAAEHPADVIAIQERDAERAIEKLEREERLLSRELKKAGRFKKRTPDELRELLAGVPF